MIHFEENRMLTKLSLQISQMLSAIPEINSTQPSIVQENQFWIQLKSLKQMGLCHPLITIVTDQGVFARFKLLRPFLEFEIFIQSTNPKILQQKLTLSLRKSSSTSLVESLHYRPILKKMQELPPEMALHWSSKINPLEGCSIQWALAGVYEMKVTIPKKALFIRTFMCELQRILWALEYLKCLSFSLSLDHWKNLWLDYRECFFQIQEIISGHRIFPNLIIIGGVNKDINRGCQRQIQKYLLELSQTLSMNLNLFLEKTHFLKGFLPIDRDDLEKINYGGMIAKASHSYWDARLFAPYGLENYTPVILKHRRLPLGDGFDRLQSVCDELLRSLKNLKDIIAKLSKINQTAPLSNPLFKEKIGKPKGTFVVEGASGPIYASVIDQKIAISTSSMRASSQLSYLLFDIEDEKTNLALASLGYQACEGCLA